MPKEPKKPRKRKAEPDVNQVSKILVDTVTGQSESVNAGDYLLLQKRPLVSEGLAINELKGGDSHSFSAVD